MRTIKHQQHIVYKSPVLDNSVFGSGQYGNRENERLSVVGDRSGSLIIIELTDLIHCKYTGRTIALQSRDESFSCKD